MNKLQFSFNETKDILNIIKEHYKEKNQRDKTIKIAPGFYPTPITQINKRVSTMFYEWSKRIVSYNDFSEVKVKKSFLGTETITIDLNYRISKNDYQIRLKDKNGELLSKIESYVKNLDK